MLNSSEIANKTFNKTFGMGYRVDDVDQYLQHLSYGVGELLEVNSELEKKLEVLADKLNEYREDEESLRSAVLGAQKLGDSIIRESKTKAEIVMRDATIKAEAMLNNAQRQIDREKPHWKT
jgi:cell division initiation protein